MYGEIGSRLFIYEKIVAFGGYLRITLLEQSGVNLGDVLPHLAGAGTGSLCSVIAGGHLGSSHGG